MFENKLLLAVSVNNDRVAVKSLDDPLELESVCKDTGYGNTVFSRLIKENIL